jgi:hypothetical protein
LVHDFADMNRRRHRKHHLGATELLAALK